MADLKVRKSALKGAIRIPSSKSHTMRAILFGCLGKGKTIIHNYLKSPDSAAMIQAFGQFGVEIHVGSTTLEILGVDGKLQACEDVIHAGNSGQVLRFIGSLAALLPSYTVITGDPSIRHHRPVQPLLSALNQLGALAVSSRLDEMAPIIIRGPLQTGTAHLSGEDSQPVSALLMAASFLQGTTYLEVSDPGEKPWIDLTLFWLKKLGGNVSHHDYKSYTITGPLSYQGFEMTIPGDFSSAAFPIAAALITQSLVTLENIDMDDIQGDKRIIDVLAQMGARFEFNKQKHTLTIYPTPQLIGTKVDANEIIDAIPILAVLGCFASGTTEIFNAAIARKKESDRLHTIALELRKMGAQITEHEDGLTIYSSSLVGTKVFSHSDHRIAMALAVAGLATSGETLIENTGCIAKSYPSFAIDFQKIGAQIKESDD